MTDATLYTVSIWDKRMIEAPTVTGQDYIIQLCNFILEDHGWLKVTDTYKVK